MLDIIKTLLDFNWPTTYFQAVLPSYDLAADHSESGDSINTPECSYKTL